MGQGRRSQSSSRSSPSSAGPAPSASDRAGRIPAPSTRGSRRAKLPGSSA